MEIPVFGGFLYTARPKEARLRAQAARGWLTDLRNAFPAMSPTLDHYLQFSPKCNFPEPQPPPASSTTAFDQKTDKGRAGPPFALLDILGIAKQQFVRL